MIYILIRRLFDARMSLYKSFGNSRGQVQDRKMWNWFGYRRGISFVSGLGCFYVYERSQLLLIFDNLRESSSAVKPGNAENLQLRFVNQQENLTPVTSAGHSRRKHKLFDGIEPPTQVAPRRANCELETPKESGPHLKDHALKKTKKGHIYPSGNN